MELSIGQSRSMSRKRHVPSRILEERHLDQQDDHDPGNRVRQQNAVPQLAIERFAMLVRRAVLGNHRRLPDIFRFDRLLGLGRFNARNHRFVTLQQKLLS
ncbi:hypothetical protein JQ604_00730 [Bradyrhizobium jicamae]|uniref:hypothetical protein n=1 Tax=Bradyrhizobium jicamae TaxID=280332 RepID=UPI001BA91DD2|nr:hypothetical protein [Bradyrhizobium jicamae]MBR0750702.1 hypothetical protein [Bradyrhizobium jicamae]